MANFNYLFYKLDTVIKCTDQNKTKKTRTRTPTG